MDVKPLWSMKNVVVALVALIVGLLETMNKHFEEYMEQIRVAITDAYLRKIAPLGTTWIFGKGARKFVGDTLVHS